MRLRPSALLLLLPVLAGLPTLPQPTPAPRVDTPILEFVRDRAAATADDFQRFVVHRGDVVR